MTDRRGPALLGLLPLLLLTGCGGGAATPPAPARTPPASAAPTPSTPVAASASPTAAPVDWKALTFAQAACRTREEWAADGTDVAAWDAVQPGLSTADVTGDGQQETLTTTSCPATTSSWPDVVAVWDTTGPEPRPLLLSDDLDLRGAVVEPGDGELSVSGPVVAGSDPNCCPGHWASLRWTWTGAEFEPTERLLLTAPAEEGTGAPAPPDLVREPVAEGTSHALLRGGGEGVVVLDAVELTVGEDARRACAEDTGSGDTGGGDTGGEECGEVFVRNDDPRLRAAPLAADARTEVLGADGTTPQRVEPGDLAALEDSGRAGPDGSFWEVETDGGRVTRLTEVFVP